MDNLQRFVAEQNVARFVVRLQDERDPDARDQLQRLLLDEVRQFGARAQQLAALGRLIAESDARAAAQQRLVDRQRASGEDLCIAQGVLRNLIALREFLIAYRGDMRRADGGEAS